MKSRPDQKTILLIENEALDRISRAKDLENCGYTIIRANSGEQATGWSGRPPAPIRFLRKPFAQKRMLAEAFFRVGVFWFVIRFLPFVVLKRLIGEPESPGTDPSGKTDTPDWNETNWEIPEASGKSKAPDWNATDLKVPDTVEPGASDPDETDQNVSDVVGPESVGPDSVGPESDPDSVGTDNITSDPVAAVARSVVAVSRRVPWESKCLVQAAATRMMLKKRGIANTMFLGVSKSGLKGLDPQTGTENSGPGEGLDLQTGTENSGTGGRPTASGKQNAESTDSLKRDMRPHAWLVVGGQVVLGGGNLDDYVTVSRFDS